MRFSIRPKGDLDNVTQNRVNIFDRHWASSILVFSKVRPGYHPTLPVND